MMRTRYAFPVFWVITLITFFPSIGSGFVFDFLGWQRVFDAGTFADIWTCFGYKGNLQFNLFVFYSFYKLFHIEGWPWYVFFCSLHAINGYLIYLLLARVTKLWNKPISPTLALAGICVYLIHPYHVEPVVWKVCAHYLLSLMAVLSIFILFLQYIENGKRINLLAGCIIYLLSLFTLEISFITPLVITITGFLIYRTATNSRITFLRGIRFASGLWTLLGGYILLNIISLGSVVGHYGGKVHLQFNLIQIASTQLKYLIKHFFYARFYSFKTKSLLFDQITSTPEVAFFFITFLVAVLMFYFIRMRTLKPYIHIIFLCFITSMLYLLPVSNLYFYHIGIGMNDRFSYIPLAFLFMGLIVTLAYTRAWIRYVVLGMLLFIHIYFQQKTISYWRQSTEVLTGLKSDFRWHDAPFVFILNSPDNFNGIVMASITQLPSGIEELIDYQTDHPFDGKMFDVFQYNMTNVNDGVKVEQTGPMQLKVTFNQWGNWWHRNGIGATTYENEYYKAETLDYPYLLTFKQYPEGSVILYQDGKQWKEFKLSP
jgi:hypothetical protein